MLEFLREYKGFGISSCFPTGDIQIMFDSSKRSTFMLVTLEELDNLSYFLMKYLIQQWQINWYFLKCKDILLFLANLTPLYQCIPLLTCVPCYKTHLLIASILFSKRWRKVKEARRYSWSTGHGLKFPFGIGIDCRILLLESEISAVLSRHIGNIGSSFYYIGPHRWYWSQDKMSVSSDTSNLGNELTNLISQGKQLSLPTI